MPSATGALPFDAIARHPFRAGNRNVRRRLSKDHERKQEHARAREDSAAGPGVRAAAPIRQSPRPRSPLPTTPRGQRSAGAIPPPARAPDSIAPSGKTRTRPRPRRRRRRRGRPLSTTCRARRSSRPPPRRPGDRSRRKRAALRDRFRGKYRTKPAGRSRWPAAAPPTKPRKS